VLGQNLLSLFLLGSAVFPGFEPHLADIDFHAVTERALEASEERGLADLHARLASELSLGRLLDGYYVRRELAVEAEPPGEVLGVAAGRVRPGSRRDAGGWALERAHVHAGACAVLSGVHPRTLYAEPSAAELWAALHDELEQLAAALEPHLAYSVLNLCRLAYSLRTGDVVVSKVRSADWALRELPQQWRPLIEEALRLYRGGRGSLPRGEVDAFYRFVSDGYATETR
jgi:streptomycin 3"-adenylyltransferase